MKTNIVVERQQLRGSSDGTQLQRVATVYVDGEEYRVLAPPRAVGDAIDWIGEFSVRQPDPESFYSEILVEGAYKVLVLKLVREELEKATGACVPAPAPEGQALEKWHLVQMASEVPTLGNLRELPTSKQALLLLRRLATQYPRSDMTFGKMNFELQVHAADLASGYPANEVTAVKDLLLGAPWKKLEADGLIRDKGNNFFHVTTEGYEAAKRGDAFFASREIIEALKLLHPDFRGYGHYFHENKLREAVAAAFERYENRLNEIRDKSHDPEVMSASGHPLVYKLFAAKILKPPYPQLGSNTSAKEAYQQGLAGMMSGGISWLRNAFTHEKHNLLVPTQQETLELLFVASYLMRMLDLSCY